MLLRSIRASLGRYLAILGIIALGVGFFAGLKSAQPVMLSTADAYLRQLHFQDFQLLSTLGFTAEDAEAFASLEGVARAEGGYFADVLIGGSGGQEVYHVMSLPEQVDLPDLTAGRLPERADECLADSHAFSEADLGKTLTLSEENDVDVREMLPGGSYTVVGLARSPRYISDSRGSTSLGSGSIRGFLFLPTEAFSSEAYHEIRLWCDLPGELYSEEYGAARDRMEAGIKRLLSRRGSERYAVLRAEADEELAEARAEIDRGWADLEQGRMDGEAELAEARQKLVNAEELLRKNAALVNQGRIDLEEGMAQIPAARQEIAENLALIEENRQQVEIYRALLDEAKILLTENEETLLELIEASDAARYAELAPYYQEVYTIRAEIYLLNAAIEAAESGQPNAGDPEELRARLAQRETDLDAAEAALSEAEANFDPENAELVEAETILAEIRAYVDDLEAQISEGEQAIADGLAQIAEAEARLDAAERDYPENLRRLDAAEAELIRGWEEVNEGWEQYYDGEAKLERELADGEQKLADAERELADAAAEIEEKLKLELYTLDRETNQGYVTFNNDTSIVDGIADVFPLFFALVAAMVCVTTMTRMVNEERTVIGTMKAMGYGGGAVMSKYLIYSGSSALLGCLGGFFLGSTAIPYLVWIAYGIMYDYGTLEISFSHALVGLSLAVAVAGTAAVTYLACRRELSEKPAELIRPKAPKKGRRILLEYIRPLWRRLPFLSKVSLRNAFRYPVRVGMMLLGIGGCTALMVAGFGAKDSIARISEYQYGEIFLYDMSVSLDTDSFADDGEMLSLWEGETSLCALTAQEPVTLIFQGREKSTRCMAALPGELDGVVSLHDEHGELPFPGKGEAVIAQKLSDLLGVKAGDAVTVRTDGGEEITLTVTAVCKNYLNHYVFLSLDSLPGMRRNTALLTAAEGVDADRLGARLRSEKGVTYVSLTRQERELMEQSMASLDLLVAMLVVCSGALAFITLYNLTNINIMERTREIATVKVLGFYPAETASYILRENVLLSVLGALFGLLLGKGLHYIVVRAVVVEYMTYDVRIAPLSYVLSFGITLVFTVLTNAVMRRKLERVDMAESLNSVE